MSPHPFLEYCNDLLPLLPESTLLSELVLKEPKSKHVPSLKPSVASRLTHSKNQRLFFFKGLQDSISSALLPSPTTLTASPSTLPPHCLPATPAVFLLLEHAGSLLPQDFCTWCFFPQERYVPLLQISTQKSPPQEDLLRQLY